MKLYITSYVVVFLSGGLGYAQQTTQYTDSLRKQLNQHPSADSIRVNMLKKLGNALAYSLPQQAMNYTNQALKLSEQIRWDKGVGYSYRQKGVLYFNMGDYVNAIDYYHKAMSMGERLKDKALICSLHGNLAGAYMELSEFDKALTNFNQSLRISRELKLTYEESVVLMNIGIMYSRKEDYKKALTFFNTSYTIAQKNHYDQITAYVLSNKGVALLKIPDHQTAIKSFDEAIRYADKVNDVRIKAQSLGGIGEAFFMLKQYDKAEAFAKQDYQLSEKLNLRQFQKEVAQMLSDIYVQQKKSDQALTYYKKYISLRDSTIGEEKKIAITRKDMQFEQEKREAVLNAKHEAAINEQRTERNAAFGGGGLLLLAGAAGFLLYKRKREADEQTKEAELKAEIADTEMKALRAQMNPHFIFNSLNSISDYVVKNETKTADYYLSKFAKLMRLILENSEKKQVMLADDLQALELYMQLEAMRMRNHFTYEIQVDDALDPHETLIPPLLLQPFVENSIWHGLAWKEGAGKITVRILKEGDMINCVVEDDGVGRKQAEAAKPGSVNVERKSLGMKITNARIAIINQQRKQTNNQSDVLAVTLSDLAEGTRVEVRLPLALSF